MLVAKTIIISLKKIKSKRDEEKKTFSIEIEEPEWIVSCDLFSTHCVSKFDVEKEKKRKKIISTWNELIFFTNDINFSSACELKHFKQHKIKPSKLISKCDTFIAGNRRRPRRFCCLIFIQIFFFSYVHICAYEYTVRCKKWNGKGDTGQKGGKRIKCWNVQMSSEC